MRRWRGAGRSLAAWSSCRWMGTEKPPSACRFPKRTCPWQRDPPSQRPSSTSIPGAHSQLSASRCPATGLFLLGVAQFPRRHPAGLQVPRHWQCRSQRTFPQSSTCTRKPLRPPASTTAPAQGRDSHLPAHVLKRRTLADP
uniref:Uncharacterized protein LOC123616912 isoform X2 n=1 Tax=Camelus bactrianus TaxID=9837 RepID=A0A9W3G5Q9_CAMBA|nr:uncharacterized protein LOC123616912 isoform X2 [Camelus bactrianus]